MSEPVFPAFLKLSGKKVVLVGGGAVAASKLAALLEAGARVTVVAPEIVGPLERARVSCVRRAFEPSDLDGAWLAVAAAPPEINSRVARAAEERRVFVNAVDDPGKASAYLGGVLRRGGITIAVSTEGTAPALAGLLREALEAVLPDDVSSWKETAREARRRWRENGVPVSERRPLLLEALNELYARKRAAEGRGRPRNGRSVVALVGAGPGDPGLLTQRGARLLEEADVVLYDALVSRETLELAARARKIFVGKRARTKSISQEAIHRLTIREARAGRRVVRLKCGDPFVLGRGGEEALALAGAGLAFEVVPGVSSALAAPALAGIPVTHRGIASGFAVVSGHSEAAFRSAVGSLAPGALTLVVLMGVANRSAIARALVELGWRRETPAALLLSASTRGSASWTGTLDSLGEASFPDASPDAPGTLAIGEVVSLAETLKGISPSRSENSLSASGAK
ncbi:uroporphyrinogen-III C-methyltransferase [bacterium]|nr:uroporphyrinogen-III C-methyltransferase [bacterium]